MAKIAVVGSRGIEFCQVAGVHVERFVASLPEGTTVVSGGAKGVDRIAVRTAELGGIPVVEHRPNYKAFNPSIAPLVRNDKIAKDCDGLVAFWDGKSRGTADVVRKAKRLGKPVWVWTLPGSYEALFPIVGVFTENAAKVFKEELPRSLNEKLKPLGWSVAGQD